MTAALDAAAHRMLAALGVTWPDAHPGTGEPFVSALGVSSISARPQLQRMTPQSKPTRTIVEYDDDGYEVSRRERTDDELAKAVAAWEEWQRRGWTFAVKGPPPRVTGAFTTASGATAAGEWTGSGWSWGEWRGR